MEKPITFDEIIEGRRVTVTHGPTHYATIPLEAPYDVTEREFDGGRDAPPLADDNPLARWALGMPQADCSRNEYAEIKLQLDAINDEIAALQARQHLLANQLYSLKNKPSS